MLDIALPLIGCDRDETAFYDCIGVPQISVVELFRAHLFIDELFQTLTQHQQRELLQTLFKTSTLKNCDKEFLELVRNYPCITCQDGKVSHVTPQRGTHRSLNQLRALHAVYDPDNRSVADLLALSRDYCPDVVPLPDAYWSAQRGIFLAGMRLVGFNHVLRVPDLHSMLLTLQYVLARLIIADFYI